MYLFFVLQRATFHQSESKICPSGNRELSRTFKILHSFDPEFQRRIFVANKNASWMLLEGRYRPHVVHTFLDGFIQGKGLMSPCDQNHDLQIKHKNRSIVLKWSHSE